MDHSDPPDQESSSEEKRDVAQTESAALERRDPSSEAVQEAPAPDETEPRSHGVSVMQEVTFKGPLPPPAILAAFDSIVPGSAKQIMDMAPREQAHRHRMNEGELELNRDALRAKKVESLIGQVFAFVIAMTAILGGIVLAAYGFSLAGLTALVSALVALVTAFIANQYFRARTEREQPESTAPSDVGDTEP